MADIAAEFAIGVGATSKATDRLENRGWVVRQPNPADRRSSLLALTDDGLRLTDAAEGTFTQRLAALIGDTSPTSPIAAAARALAELRAALERDQVGLPTG